MKWRVLVDLGTATYHDIEAEDEWEAKLVALEKAEAEADVSPSVVDVRPSVVAVGPEKQYGES